MRESCTALALVLAACAAPARGPEPARAPVDPADPEAPEATSLLGAPLARPPLPAARRAALEADLAAARARLAAAPGDEEALVWVGRRQAYLGSYRDALATYTRGLELHRGSHRLLRHRGHRWITVRELERAVLDLEEAARRIDGVPDEVEPDGQPNAKNLPRSTTHSNVWYHLALARYLRGEDEEALSAWNACRAFARNDDMLVATLHWTVTTLRRLGRPESARELLAPVHAGMDVIENTGYHRLLLFYRGELTEEELLGGLEDGSVERATVGYGLAAWLRAEGDAARADALCERIVAAGPWPAFGALAAEADLARR